MTATIPRVRIAPVAAAAAAALAALVAGAASAQSLNANSASFNAGWGRTPDLENRPVEFTTRDANGNQVIVNGQIMKGSDQSAFSFNGGGVASASAGAGFGGATAIGNSLNVITQGSYNTVIVDSVQTNTGDVTATQSGNGGHG